MVREATGMDGKEWKVEPRIQGQKRLGKLIAEHYGGAHEVKKTGSQPIVWSGAGAASEILWAMGFYVQFPEAYAATCGAKHLAHYNCEVSESYGYEHHLCTYCRNSIGLSLAEIDDKGAVEPLARPDLLVSANGSCILATKWWEHLSHYWNVPLFSFDCPINTPGVDAQEVAEHMKRQCEEFIKFLEKFSRKKMDYDRLAEICSNTKACVIEYRKMLRANVHHPAPATFFDLIGHNFPAIALRYKPEAAEHYRLMTAELNERIANGIVPMANMKYRIYWDGVPYWFALRSLSEKLQSLGMCLVTSTYLEAFGFEGIATLDPSRSLDFIATLMGEGGYHNKSIDYKARKTEQLCRDFKVDAALFAYSLSCKPFALPMHYVADHLQKQLGIPVTMIDGDLVDETFYNEERNNMKLLALAETLAAR